MHLGRALLVLFFLTSISLAAPDLVGFDGRPYGGTYTSYCYEVQESSAYWGESIHLKFSVYNQGDTVAGPFAMRFYLSTDTTIGSASDYLFGGSIVFTGLASGGIRGYTSYAVTIPLPSADPVGAASPYYLGMTVDYSNTVSESNESNNNSQGAGKDYDSITILTPQPDILVSDSTDPSTDRIVDFGNVVDDGKSNSIGRETVTIANPGRASLTVAQNGIVLTNGTQMYIESIYSSIADFISLSASSNLIASKSRENWLVTLCFDPSVTGRVTDTLRILSNDPDEPLIQVSLVATGVPVPDIVLSESTLDFGGVAQDGAGGKSAVRTVAMRNTGSGPLTVAQNGLSLLTGTDFHLLSVTSSLDGAVNLSSGAATLAQKGNETWTIRLSFDPVNLGALSDGLQINSDDPDEAVTTVALTGIGQRAPDIQALDSVAPSGDLRLDFGGTHADGAGHYCATGTVSLINTGEAVLTIASNGIALPAGAFAVDSIVSSTAGTVDLSAGPATIAGGTQETWRVTVLFDPTAAGAASNQLVVTSDDADESPLRVVLLGTGLTEPDLCVGDTVFFGPVLNDGSGGREATETLVLCNLGALPLTVAQNGLGFGATNGYRVVQIVSSLSGAVNLSPASDIIGGTNSETWTVTLGFDPAADGSITNVLRISSNDPDEATALVALSGEGVRPSIAVSEPATDLGIPAEKAYRIEWQDEYTAGNAAISLYADADTNPNAGLVPIVAGLSEDSTDNFFMWQPPVALTGGPYYLYAQIADGSVTQGAYSAGRVTIEGVNSFRLLSPSETANGDYAYRYEYDGVVYSGRVSLAVGENTIVQFAPDGQGGTIAHEFHVTRVDSLIDRAGYAYDAMGRVTSVTNARGIVTTYTYDAMDRLEKTETSWGSVTEFGYNPVGNVVRMHDASGWTFYGYDELDRMTSVTWSADAEAGNGGDLMLTHEYDLAGQQTAVTYPGGTRIEYGRDPAGRLTAITNKADGTVTAYAYHSTNGLLAAVTRPNGIRTRFTYDGSARVTDIRHERASDSGLIALYQYILDAGGRRTELHLTTPAATNAQQYTFDDLDRLVEAVYSDDDTFDSADRVVSYTYDGNGNRLTMAVNEDGGAPEEVRYYSYGNENRLLAVTNAAGVRLAQYAYDAAGNCVMKVTPSDVTHYDYDERNLLIRAVNGTNYAEYGYDGAGVRVAKTVNGVRTRFVIDPVRTVWETVEERDAAGAVLAEHVYGPDRAASTFEAPVGACYALCDALGNVRQLSDATGGVTDVLAYDVFGATDGWPTHPNAYFFAGERTDPETGLVFLRARYYEPETGRFISKDPMGIAAALNSYVYVGNDPVDKIDPLGLDEQTAFEKYINGIVDVNGQDVKNMVYYGINSDRDDAVRAAQEAGLDMSETLVAAEYWNDGGGLASTIQQCLIVAGRQIGLGTPSVEGAALAGKTIQNVYYFSGGGVVERMDAIAYNINFVNEYSFGSTVGPDGYTQLLGEFTHGNSLGGLLTDIAVGLVPHAVTIGPSVGSINSYDSQEQTVLGAGFTIKCDSIFESVANFLGFGKSSTSASSSTTVPDVGGVLIDKAATFVGSNLCNIVGATYDPVSHQIVFLGTNDASAVKDINMDYFYTAIQAVYGSAVPPFVTLDPPAQMASSWVDLGDGDGVFEQGELGGFVIRYNPIWCDSLDDMRVRFRMHWGDTNYDFTAYVDGLIWSNIIAGGRYAMDLKITNWAGRPTGVNTQKFGYTQLHLSSKGQDTYYNLILTNNSGGSFLIDSVNVVPNRQHRKYGGRVDGTRLGWVMYEADRVMKCLGVGIDNLTGAVYDHTTVSVTGYSNLMERSLSGSEAGNIRFWFVPDEMTLKRHVDPETGRSTIVFDEASVALKTESFMRGLPQTPVAREFADHFNEHYDEYAAQAWPVMDPDDPTGQTIIQVKIFERLREAMQAVSLARFFRDNNIPLDMWWLNSWTPPKAYSPKTVPTAYNEVTNGTQWVLLYGGVEVNKPNAYVPSATAESVGGLVLSARPDEAGDLDEQTWTVSGTTEGTLTAVAASIDAQAQFGNTRRAETDIEFQSPGDFRLTMGRYYDSGRLGDGPMGPGWRLARYGLEFSRPTWSDEHGLMRDASTNALWTDSGYDTRLRSGEIRFMDYATGQYLDFSSSLALAYDVDNLGHPIILLSGLNSNNLPVFTAGARADGSSLIQNSDTLKGYRVVRPDGSVWCFDYQGVMLSVTDRHDYAQSYRYATNGLLTNVADSAAQALAYTYNASGRLVSVVGPGSEQMTYTYDAAGRVTNALHVRSGAAIAYGYNENNQLVYAKRSDGVTLLDTAADLCGRTEEQTDARGNVYGLSFEVETSTLSRVVTVVDESSESGVTWSRTMDSQGRLVEAVDASGNSVALGYSGDSVYPDEIALPIAGRQAIEIKRNALGLPVEITDPDNAGARPVTVAYNAANKPVAVTNALGHATQYEYNADHDRLAEVKQLDGQEVKTTFGYFNGYLAAVTNALGFSAKYDRDSVGRITNMTDATGVRMSLAYDTLGRLASIDDPRYASPVVLTYNSFDQVVCIATPSGTMGCGYDPVTHRCTAATNLNGAVTRFEYDPDTGDLVREIRENRGYATITNSYVYDRLGQLAKLTDPEGNEQHFSYDDLGQLIGRAEVDRRPPGPPELVGSDAALDGIWTNAADHTFRWAAPETDSGIEGYSWTMNSEPDTNEDTTAATATQTGLAEGQYTFQVRARSRTGLWGPAAVFNLWLDRTVPSALGATVAVARSDCGDYVVGTSVGASWSGFSDALSGVDRYYFGFSDGGGSGNGQISYTTGGNLSGPALDATNRIYVWACDRAGNLGPATSASVLVLDPASDRDGDGMSNGAEETAGTGSDDPNEVLWLNPELRAADGKLEVTWFAVSNRVYDLLMATNLNAGGWQTLADCTNRAGNQAGMTYTGSVPVAGQQLYRVRVRKP